MDKKVTIVEINSEFFFIEERDDFHAKSLTENDYAYHRKTNDIGIVSDYNESTGSWTYSDIENNISSNRDAYKLFKVIASTMKLENVINVSYSYVATLLGKIKLVDINIDTLYSMVEDLYLNHKINTIDNYLNKKDTKFMISQIMSYNSAKRFDIDPDAFKYKSDVMINKNELTILKVSKYE